MGEIKSTLDIIMEKTRGLTMTEEEKGEFKRQEARRKIKGLIQKFFDGILDLDKFKIETAALGKEEPRMINQIVAEETVKSIRPGIDNDACLKILESVANLETGPVRKILADAGGELERAHETHEVALRKAFDKKGISGSAMIPNMKADPAWVPQLQKIKEAFEEKIKTWMAELYPETSI